MSEKAPKYRILQITAAPPGWFIVEAQEEASHPEGFTWEQHEIAFWALCEDQETKETHVMGMHRFDAQQPGRFFLPPEGHGHDDCVVGYRSPSETDEYWRGKARERMRPAKSKG